jgi:predicted nucleic acid-binding protein
VASLDSSAQSLIRKIVENASEIHLADAQAIVLARETKALLLMDESTGRVFAEAWGIKTKGTVYVVMSALRGGLINKDEAKETVLKMVSKGFRLEPNLLARLIVEIERENRLSDNASRLCHS